MKKIIVSVTNDLETDQRVQKVCESLVHFGFEVVLVGRCLPTSKSLKFPYQTKRFNLLFNKGFLFYANYSIVLFFYLLKTKATHLLSNDLDTLLPNFIVSKLKNLDLIYDSHELFSEVPEVVNRPVVKKVWIGLESFLLPKLHTCYTVSESIAKYYNSKYSSSFEVIYNYPVFYEPKKNCSILAEETRAIILYQGAVNIGRGIELMIDCMMHIEDALLVIVGGGDIFLEIQEKVSNLNLEDKVLLMGRVSPEVLKGITPYASLGLSLEEDLGLNYRYAMPNKIFDYVMAEVPVLVSDLPEMRSVINKYKIGWVVESRSSIELAIQINNILEIDSAFFSSSLHHSRKRLNWESQENVLRKIFD